jgi:hypothetical protein
VWGGEGGGWNEKIVSEAIVHYHKRRVEIEELLGHSGGSTSKKNLFQKRESLAV